MRHRGVLVLGLLVASMPARPASAQVIQLTKAGVVTTLQGTATVARQTTLEPQPLKFKDDLFVQDRVTTGEQSLARILLGGKAVVTVREHSTLTITERPGSSTIEVGSGKVALAVARERMRPGEFIEVKTPNAVAGVRGTVLVAEVFQATAQSTGTPPAAVTSRFTLLTGAVDLALLDPATGRPIGNAVVMSALQSLGVTGSAPLGAPRGITRTEAQAMASDFRVKLPEAPPAVNQSIVDRQVQQAVNTAAATGPAVPRVVVRETTSTSPRVDGDDIRPRVVPPITPTVVAPTPDDNGGEHCGNGHGGHHGGGHGNGSIGQRRTGRRGDQIGEKSPGRSRGPRPAVTSAK